VEQAIEPAIADVFDADSVGVAITHAQPEVVIEQLTSHPYTRESMSAAAALNTRIRLEGEQCAGGSTGSGSAALPEAVDRTGEFLVLD